MKRATLFSLMVGLSTLASPARTTMASPARTKISDRDAVRAIIGEGANQSDVSSAGIASAIHIHRALAATHCLCYCYGLAAD